MCFRPSAVKGNDTLAKTCETCGMPTEENVKNCPYCRNLITSKVSDDLKNSNLNPNTRIL